MPALGLAPHLMQATARSSSCVPQFRQNIIASLVGFLPANFFAQSPGSGEEKLLGFGLPAAQAVPVVSEGRLKQNLRVMFVEPMATSIFRVR